MLGGNETKLMTVLEILAIIALVFVGLNGFEFAHMIVFARPLGVIQAFKVVIWAGTCVLLTGLGSWWVFLIGLVLVGVVNGVATIPSVSEAIERSVHPWYLNPEVGYDEKFRRMFSEDLGKGITYLLASGAVFALIICLAMYLRAMHFGFR